MEIIDLETRPQVVEKTIYEPMWPNEEFIVPLLKQHIEIFLSADGIPTKSTARVLDVGCGNQPFRKELEQLGYKYISTDVNQSITGNVDVLCEIDKDISNELLKLGPFDLIFCTEVMEHIVDWNMAFLNFSQLLNPGGKLFITCPHFYQLHEVPYDFWRPTPYALKYFANKHGLNIISQENAGNAWDILGTIFSTTYALPASSSFRDRLLNRIVNRCIKFLFNLLRDRSIQQSVQLKSSLYMSNIFLCQK